MKNRNGFIEIAALVLAAAAFLGGAYLMLRGPVQKPTAQFGATGSPAVQAQPFYLSGGGITANATTALLTSFDLPSGQAITISMFGGAAKGYATIEPGTVREENISFTGVTQNADGTAYLTGITRGLDFYYPCTASSSLQKSHAGGTSLVLSNSACFYGNNFLTQQNDASITAQYEFSKPPLLDTESTNASSAVTYHQLASTSIAGAVPATPSVAGIIKIATSGDAFNSKTSSTYYFVPDASVFSGTPSSSVTYQVPVAQSGTIAAGWLPNPLASLTINTATSTATTTDNFNLLPAGVIQMYASSTAPAGWLLANGTSYATSSYPRLFAVIGYTYGGSTSTFNVPDMRGRFVAGPSSTLSTTIGVTGGSINSTTTSNVTPNYNSPNGYYTGVSSGYNAVASVNNGTINVTSTPPYIIMNYIIKY